MSGTAPINISFNNVTEMVKGRKGLEINNDEVKNIKIKNDNGIIKIDGVKNKRFIKVIGNSYSEVKTIYLTLGTTHTYNGKQGDAEIIILGRSSIGNTVKKYTICIPILVNNSPATSNEYFRNIIPETINNGKSLEIKNTGKKYSINDIIPKAPYYYYNGDFEGINGDMFIFDLYDGITMSRSEFNKIKGGLSNIRNFLKINNSSIRVLKNNIGTTMTNDIKKNIITCTPIIEGQEFNKNDSEQKNEDDNFLPGLSKETREKIMMAFLSFLSVIIGILFFYILYKVFLSSAESIKRNVTSVNNV